MTQRILSFTLLFSLYLTASGSEIPPELRGGIEADKKLIAKATEMQKAGWAYTMPVPKTKKSSWGNSDPRTTWWRGYWTNKTTQSTSALTPRKLDGKWRGDRNVNRGWRRGGSPRRPSKLEWLLSKHGGIPPK
jgi:hypothetical protein